MKSSNIIQAMMVLSLTFFMGIANAATIPLNGNLSEGSQDLYGIVNGNTDSLTFDLTAPTDIDFEFSLDLGQTDDLKEFTVSLMKVGVVNPILLSVVDQVNIFKGVQNLTAGNYYFYVEAKLGDFTYGVYHYNISKKAPVVTVPELPTLQMLGLGLILLFSWRYRQSNLLSHKSLR